MPLFSKNFIDFIIEPTWKLVVSLQYFYLEMIISGKEIVFSHAELELIEAQNHNYSRGYESEDEEETYGLEGLLKELIKFLTISLENNQVKKKLKSYLPVFLLLIKNYSIMPNETLSLWKNDQNNFIMEEFNDCENSSTLRFSSVKLIQSIIRKIDPDSAFGFIKAMISEFQSDQSNNTYSALSMLDNSQNVEFLINNLNNNSDYFLRKCEANLHILSELTHCLIILMKKKKLDLDKIKEISMFLQGLLQSPKSILSDRAIWCIANISEVLVNEKETLIENFSFVGNLLLNQNNNLSTNLISAKSLKKIADLIMKDNKLDNPLEPYLLINLLNEIIEFLKSSSEETINIPIECLMVVSKLNTQSALAHSNNLISLVLETYLKNHNDVNISSKLIELIDFWSKNLNTEKIILEFFIHLFVYLTDAYFNRISKQVSIQKYLKIRKILSIQVNEPQIKINSETIMVYFKI